jgi:uncharacterized protein (TIGR02996 family)
MSDDAAFLRAITAAPDDAAPRLVYADWLDERGDPRGEFIRLQTAMDALPVSGEAYAARRPRREALRAEIDPAWLAAMGYTLRHRPLFTHLPPTRPERWRLVEEFISIWRKPLGPRDGYSEDELEAAERRLGFALPLALREWYALAGRRDDVWSIQDHLLAPHEVRVDPTSGLMMFRIENQNCEQWGIRSEDVARDDPPVLAVGPERAVSPAISVFVCQVLLSETKFASGLISGAHERGPLDLDRLGELLSPCALSDVDGVTWPTHFFEGSDLLVDVVPRDWAWVTARTETALAWFLEQSGWEIERYD